LINSNTLKKVRSILSEEISINLKTKDNSNFEKDCYSKLALLINDTMILTKQIEQGEDSYEKNLTSSPRSPYPLID